MCLENVMTFLNKLKSGDDLKYIQSRFGFQGGGWDWMCALINDLSGQPSKSAG